MTEGKCLATFQSIHNVMKMEELLIKEGISVDIMPLPRKISDSCGMGIVFTCSDRENLKKTALNSTIDITHLYRIEKGEFIEYKEETV